MISADCMEEAALASSDCLVVDAMHNKFGAGRLGITVSVKLGCAVQRNRIKRLIREA